MKVALVCIAKNEENYIKEWFDYHFKLGFDNIIIYQNDWRLSENYDNVIKIEYDGGNKQIEAYNHFIKNFNSDYDWVAFFDVDEFLVLKKHKNIKSFIDEYKEYPAIGINWVLFGDNDLESSNGNYNVIERFTKRQSNVNIHIKSICKLNEKLSMGVHNPTNTNWVNTTKQVCVGPFNHNLDDSVAQLNHYFCKTKEEFQNKILRGRADTNNKWHHRTMKDFDNHNFNDVEDLTAYNFFYDNNNILDA